MGIEFIFKYWFSAIGLALDTMLTILSMNEGFDLDERISSNENFMIEHAN
jgi:hypothetical protein